MDSINLNTTKKKIKNYKLFNIIIYYNLNRNVKK